jgi:hypothetical protein
LSHVVERAGHELVDDGQQRGRPIGDDLNWVAKPAERRREEPPRARRSRFEET